MAKGRILIIDDEKMACKSLSTLLGEKGYESSCAYSGEEGLKMAREGNYDVILIDIKLPDIEGLDVLKQIKSFDPETVSIIITGYPSDESVNLALGSGAYDYITKPFDVVKLSFVMERAVSYRNLLLASKKIIDESRNKEGESEQQG